MARLPASIAVLAVAILPLPASAEESAYTSIALESCQLQAPNPEDPLESGVWLCAGYQGIPVRIAESDLRFFVSYGFDAGNQQAAHQTLPPFNTIHTTLEWRLDDNGVPFATILRFFAESFDGGPAEQILVVTAISEAGACHAAYVNASVNADANVMARLAADLFARNFDCSYHAPLWIGARGTL
jgi:hypothetical protein